MILFAAFISLLAKGKLVVGSWPPSIPVRPRRRPCDQVVSESLVASGKQGKWPNG